MKILIMFAAVMFMFTADAVDLKTKSGKLYKNYSIIGICPEGLTILHSDGGGIVALEDWPDENRAEIAKYITRIEERRKRVADRPDLTTKSGMIYKKYKIIKFLPRGVKISFWSGTKIIDYSDLPDSLQKEHADKIKKAKPKSVMVLNETPAETRAPIDLKLDKPNSKAGRTKKKEKEKLFDEEIEEKPKKPVQKTKNKNKLKNKK